MNDRKKYPVFNNPEKYLKHRVSNSPLSMIKAILEKRMINKLLGGKPQIRTVCDAPCGPGRLYSFWSKRDYRVYGVDISPQMIQYAKQVHRRHDLEGGVLEGNIFKLAELLPEIPELVACFRFVYYFDKEERVGLLKALTSASSRYLLLDYKTNETYKGRRNRDRQAKHLKPKKMHLRWHFTTRSEIQHEMQQVGLIPLNINLIGAFSDRVFVLAEKQYA